MSSEVECEAFLSALKHHYKIGKLDFIFGKKNKYALTNLGISISDALMTVMELTSENYYRGPEKDHKDLEQAVWKFGMDNFFEESYPNSTLYLKISIRPSRNDMVMLSFHQAEFPIDYPLKK